LRNADTVQLARTWFHIREPGAYGRRTKTFSILVFEKPAFGKQKSKTLTHESLDGINKLYLDKTYDLETARKHCEALIERLKKEQGLTKTRVFHTDNLKVAKTVFRARIRKHPVIDPISMQCDFTRAVETLGNLSIVKDSEEDLQEVMHKLAPKTRRRVVTFLNQILIHLERGFKLSTRSPYDGDLEAEESSVHFLDKADVEKILPKVKNELHQLLFWVLFTTGIRTGEAFALLPADYNEASGELVVKRQLRRNLVKGKRKRGKMANPVVLPGGEVWVKKWFAVANETKEKIRNDTFVHSLRAACIEVFPNDQTKRLRVHDLRHSYARILADSGLTLSDIAECLGDTDAVVRTNYLGWIRGRERSKIVRKMLQKEQTRKAKE